MEEHHDEMHGHERSSPDEHGNDHPHEHPKTGLAGRIKHALTPHSHNYQTAALDAALVADGTHARIDGFTSLVVLAGAVGVWAGLPIHDPLIGLATGLAILFIAWDSAREIAYCMMDAVDPAVPELITSTARLTPGVMDVHDVAVRWVGHRQRTELHITVDCQMSTCGSHHIAEGLRHELFHAMPALVDATVHVNPCECARCGDAHTAAHHLDGATSS